VTDLVEDETSCDCQCILAVRICSQERIYLELLAIRIQEVNGCSPKSARYTVHGTSNIIHFTSD
jgi:hypothetical protein